MKLTKKVVIEFLKDYADDTQIVCFDDRGHLIDADDISCLYNNKVFITGGCGDE